MLGTELVDARREREAHAGRALRERDRAAVHREQHHIVDAGLELPRRRLVEHPATGGAVADLELVGRDVDAGVLEIGGALVVEDQVGIGLVAADRLDGVDRRLHFEVAWDHRVGFVEQADRVGGAAGRVDLVAPVGDREVAHRR